MNTKAQILRYWRAAEIFNPQSAPDIDLKSGKRTKQTDRVSRDDVLAPWQPGFKRLPAAEEDSVWRHDVYGGVYLVRRVREFLESIFGKDPQSFDSRLDSLSACFLIRVDHDGRPLFDTFVLSACVWAWGRTVTQGPDSPDWLSGFEPFADDFLIQLRQMFAVPDDDEEGKALLAKELDIGRKLTLGDVDAITVLLFKEIGLAKEVPDERARIQSRQVETGKEYQVDRVDFLNSFFVDDLKRVADAFERNDTGTALSSYLTPDREIDSAARTDTRKSVDTMYDTLAPDRFPSGRWPANGHHPLVFSQQFAINRMIRELDDGAGMFSVNGPPGTGKTTLLRDLVAHVVVKRAERLASLRSPEDAFDGVDGWESDNRQRAIYLWKPEFAGFEIVVASANNGAVENITLELPGADAIDDIWKPSVDYFPDLAARALGGDKPVWGLLAARLGNKTNRMAFLRDVWWDEKKDDPKSGEEPKNEKALPGLFSWLGEHAKRRPLMWRESVARFRQACAEESKLRAQREDWARQADVLRAARSRLGALNALARERNRATANAANAHEAAQTSHTAAIERASQARTQKTDQLHARPGFFENVFSFGRAHRDWRIRFLACVDAEQQASEAMNTTAGIANQADVARRGAEKLERETHDEIALSSDEIARLDAGLKPARTILGKHFVDREHTDRTDADQEQSSPWTDRAWNDARSKVFLEALNLHQAFAAENAHIFRSNLFGMVDILQGSVPGDISRQAVKSAWQTLFAVVPVISSTFASFGRLFSNLRREEIGWLLIDEAGQGLPQAAVGALWRARRAVVVGDPLQLEPILPLPFTSQQALRARFGVEETWTPGRQSIQRLADRISTVGTYLPDHEGNPLWVSAPLRVHRRCDCDMFKVANKIAYNGMMVFGTVTRPKLALPDTTWIHVAGRDANGHWIPDEGRTVATILDDIHAHEDASGTIYVISPFREVTQGLKDTLGSRYENVKIGTIHTVQGKESDIVLLVLGGHPDRPGAKAWASEKPNLLNVAVSRAKRRLYVIGNRDAWRDYPFFKECAALLEHRTAWPGVVGHDTATLLRDEA
ncbi:helicase [Burkholderia lata]|uniref:DEAD/DEAH box helicase n=1 Tax=Burkholderia lata (strain ATCC 17760 / DSM 23089 / LMG 22485 / NCIMB 9086 / R18194 / 383) TaxID=482957 RepID=UPI001454439E|nr:DEAD/DEAH box helicase [Burkholderia lata]VWC87399.1 helicase [Burkholderia lata]